MVPDLHSISRDILELADYDEAYAGWLSRLADLCDRFLNVNLMDIVDVVTGEVSPFEPFLEQVSPEVFFKGTIMSILEIDFGVDYLDEIVHDNVMWGWRRTNGS